jgi:hypothetical protein
VLGIQRAPSLSVIPPMYQPLITYKGYSRSLAVVSFHLD